MRSVLNRKTLARIISKRIEGDFDAVFIKIFIQDFFAGDSGHQGGYTLLSVDKYFFSVGFSSILGFHVRILPSNDIARRVAVI